MTSSPGLSCFSPNLGEVKALNATKLAEDPELTNKQCFTPIHWAKRSSNSAAYLPVVNQKSREESTNLTNSCSSNTLPDAGI